MLRRDWPFCVPIALALFCPSCRRPVDAASEQQAIRAVIEAEKKGYFDKNLEEMAATWAQTSSSVKMFLGREGEIDLVGWSKINDQSKQEIAAPDSTYKDTRLEFSDFQFNVYEASAWAVFKARWSWLHRGAPEQLQQTRLMAFAKVDGQWKITLMAIYNAPSGQEKAAGPSE